MVRIDLTADTPGKRIAHLVLSRFLDVPDAYVTILSCSKLESVGLSTVIEDGQYSLLDSQSMRSRIGSASRRMSDHLFVLNGIFVKHQSASVRLSTV